MLADFVNRTGDPVFDHTLRQGLAVQLEQSPFFGVISDGQIQQTLRLMKRDPVAVITPAIAQEICLRTRSTIVLEGSIAQIGTQYTLSVTARNCANGQSLTSTEALANDKNGVLRALEKTSKDIRGKLGESRSTIQRFGTPLPEATTDSLEALHAFTVGDYSIATKFDIPAAILFCKRLDRARATLDEAEAKFPDFPRDIDYFIAFLDNDKAGMQRQLAAVQDKPGLRVQLLGAERFSGLRKLPSSHIRCSTRTKYAPHHPWT